ncbi:unnamed protein product [Arabis nemorensis]|uniref:Uncharacterized protein n=1 Tax=Arabis nemorensis TaxID=586526 RepID=A0A565AYB8_9BRAS|nr:unnamed protein product [Arabis nemorensis]
MNEKSVGDIIEKSESAQVLELKTMVDRLLKIQQSGVHLRENVIRADAKVDQECVRDGSKEKHQEVNYIGDVVNFQQNQKNSDFNRGNFHTSFQPPIVDQDHVLMKPNESICGAMMQEIIENQQQLMEDYQQFLEAHKENAKNIQNLGFRVDSISLDERRRINSQGSTSKETA